MGRNIIKFHKFFSFISIAIILVSHFDERTKRSNLVEAPTSLFLRNSIVDLLRGSATEIKVQSNSCNAKKIKSISKSHVERIKPTWTHKRVLILDSINHKINHLFDFFLNKNL